MSDLIRQVVLDTETTGLDPKNHRIIEIGCVEMMDRRLTGNDYHQYIQPDRLIEEAAIEVHGITNEFLENKPHFAEIADTLVDYLKDAEVIIHNAPFDVGFLDAEFGRLPTQVKTDDLCQVVDTLTMARALHPGQRNSLDALCGRYDVNNAHRTKHGALLDAQILADVYLAMTGGQKSLSLDMAGDIDGGKAGAIRRLPSDRPPLPVIQATADELAIHEQRLDAIDKASNEQTVWRRAAG
jgi:DNA polymerase-3 subunit epsilon